MGWVTFARSLAPKTGHFYFIEISTRQTRTLLKQDLEYRQGQLIQNWHRLRLVQIFVEHRVYLRIEDCRTWDAVLFEIDRGLEPHKHELRSQVTEQDLVYLTEVKIKRISAWDAEKARAKLQKIDRELTAVRRDLRNLTGYTRVGVLFADAPPGLVHQESVEDVGGFVDGGRDGLRGERGEPAAIGSAAWASTTTDNARSYASPSTCQRAIRINSQNPSWPMSFRSILSFVILDIWGTDQIAVKIRSVPFFL